MTDHTPVFRGRDELLFTPGPLTTSLSVKQAMLRDMGSWHFEFNTIVAWIREQLLELAGLARADGWEVVPLQGTGTYGVEAVFQTCLPPDGKVAVLANGAYGERMVQMLQHAHIQHVVLRTPEDTPADPGALDDLLSQDECVTHVAVVHGETTTGILNPIETVGSVVRRHNRCYIVDAMSTFGGIPIDFAANEIDFLVSSSNKCIEGVPGFSYVFCRRAALEACAGFARSLSFNLLEQLRGFDKNGQFRYTPPTHSLMAFAQALRELQAEGGIDARHARYGRNHQTLLSRMCELRFRPYLAETVQSCIITAFHYPESPAFQFEALYHNLSKRGFIIYPGKLTKVNTFRIGTIGRIFPGDIEQLVSAVRATMMEMDEDFVDGLKSDEIVQMAGA